MVNFELCFIIFSEVKFDKNFNFVVEMVKVLEMEVIEIIEENLVFVGENVGILFFDVSV